MTAEIERFLADARSNASLQAELAEKGSDVDAAIELVNARGYKISRADADAYVAAHRSELSDDQLDHVAGGGHKKTNNGGSGGAHWSPDFKSKP